MDNATIFAIASGAGRAAIAVLRLSGPAVRTIVKSLAGKLPEPHTAALATFRDPATGPSPARLCALANLPGASPKKLCQNDTMPIEA
jgi:hypothetical protein